MKPCNIDYYLRFHNSYETYTSKAVGGISIGYLLIEREQNRRYFQFVRIARRYSYSDLSDDSR